MWDVRVRVARRGVGSRNGGEGHGYPHVAVITATRCSEVRAMPTFRECTMSLTPSGAAARPRRRALLTGALGAFGTAGAAGLLTGCSDGDPTAGTADAERADAARRLRARAARESETLLARYDGTAAVHPGLADRLRPLREEVARHARTLGEEDGAATSPPGASPPGASPSGPTASPRSSPGASVSPSRPGTTGPPPPDASPSPSETSPPPSPDKAAVPHDEKGALAALAGAERRLADSRTKALADAPPELARLLASVAACGGAHVYLLEEGGADQ